MAQDSSTHDLALGPVMLDVAGHELTSDERDVLANPRVGGVILFARNYESPAQLDRLTREIRAVRTPPLLIAVDHEGGRVQRFRDGFTVLPAMRRLGARYDESPEAAESALAAAHAVGVVIGCELARHGVDLSFTPVLDIDFGSSGVIGDRAFHSSPEVVGALAARLIVGLARSGVGAVGKHFPGHGFVRADSHHAVPIDERSYQAISQVDLVPYRLTIPVGLAGIMPAHVIYPKVDSNPAGFSRPWLIEVLRARLGFRGLIFSDDLSMEGAKVAGGILERANAALEAGCDMVLVCNAPETARELIDRLGPGVVDPSRIALFRREVQARERQQRDDRYLEARRLLARLS